jgi:PTH1 family peptidyl-tRNA hydrolase
MSNTKLIVGLGNPGPRYARNRHNIGFQCVELFAQRHQLALGRMQLRASVGDGWIVRQSERRKVILAKPLTYMNASGEAVGSLMRYYQLEPEDLIVLHDDLDLDAGILRLRRDGGSGGQNGIKSIIQHLGSQAFHRARIGIGRPPGRMNPADYVLQDFGPAEEELFAIVRARVCDALECWLFEGIETAMNLYNASLGSPGPGGGATECSPGGRLPRAVPAPDASPRAAASGASSPVRRPQEGVGENEAGEVS